MTWVRLGKILGIVAAIAIVGVVAVGNSPLRTPLIAFVALAVLVAGGNWLNSYLGIRRPPPQFAQRQSETPASEDPVLDVDAPDPAGERDDS